MMHMHYAVQNCMIFAVAWCLSITSRCSVKADKWIELVLEATLGLPYTVL